MHWFCVVLAVPACVTASVTMRRIASHRIARPRRDVHRGPLLMALANTLMALTLLLNKYSLATVLLSFLIACTHRPCCFPLAFLCCFSTPSNHACRAIMNLGRHLQKFPCRYRLLGNPDNIFHSRRCRVHVPVRCPCHNRCPLVIARQQLLVSHLLVPAASLIAPVRPSAVHRHLQAASPTS